MRYPVQIAIRLCVLLLLNVWACVSTSAGEEPPSTTGKRPVTVTVLDEATGKPLADTPITMSDGCGGHSEELQTDENGKVTFLFEGEGFAYVCFSAKKPGYVPTKISWSESDGETPPDTVDLALPLGTVIGGAIQDEQGEPISGAKVFLLVPTDDEIAGEPKAMPAIWDYEVKTDKKGHWRADIMPAKLKDVWIRLNHPAYVSDNHYGATRNPSMEQLRDCSGVMVMKKGFTVTGRVVNGTGDPVQGVRVSQGSDRWGSHFPTTGTDHLGCFRFRNGNPGSMVLTFECKGYGPELLELDVQDNIDNIEVVMPKPNTLRGQVVNMAGAPMENTTVVVDTWRGHRSLSLRTKTGADGRFEIEDAPADAVLVDIPKKGHMAVRGMSLTPGEEERVITLKPDLTVTAQVVDKETKEPLAKFKALPGVVFEGRERPYWEDRNAASGKDGAYSCTFTEPRAGYALRIEADGYMPVDSRVFTDDQGPVSLDFELERCEPLEGTVLAPDETPAAGVDLHLNTLSRQLFMSNGLIRESSDGTSLTTSEDGRFTLTPQTEPFTLVVADKKGWAKVEGDDFMKDRVIRLEKWARVEGQMLIGSAPGASQDVILWDKTTRTQYKPALFPDYRATADSQGRFVFERVIPGQIGIGRLVKTGANSWMTSHGVPANVKPGETISVVIGGEGRPVEGQISVSKEDREKLDWRMVRCRINTKRQKPPTPENWDSMSDEEKAAWRVEYEKTPKYLAAQAAHRSYIAPVDDKGTFRAEDIPAGEYTLFIDAYAPDEQGQCGLEKRLGKATRDFTVKGTGEKYTPEVQKLGSFDLTLDKTLETGQLAPDFKAKTLDGKEISLKDFRGKHVLLDFWATWCGPCKAATPHLKEVYEAFGQRDDFVIIGLSLDDNEQAPRDYAEQNDLRWIHGFLGEWSKTKIPSSFGVQGIPALILIDPQGKVVGNLLPPVTVKQEVSSALGAS